MRLGHVATCAALAATMLTAACGSESAAPAVVDAKQAPKPKPISQVDPQAYKADPSTAMREVPEAMRRDVQSAIVCRVNRQKSEGTVTPLDADVIRRINEAIKAGTSVDDACRL